MPEGEIPPPKPNELAIDVRVRYVECDPMNVAHHGAYPIWLEIARTELLREQGVSYRELDAQGIYFVVARMNLRYRRPAHYDDVLRVQVETLPTAGVKLEHRYEVRRGEELITTAETTLVCVDGAGKPQPVPAMLASAGRRADTT